MEKNLSILIPTYDYTCYQLVYTLRQQAEALGVQYEIIVAEDGSKSPVNIIANHKITDLSNCRHLIRKENVGRAAIRNVLIDESRGDMLLFMDADGKVIRDDFLKKYIDAAKEHDVVCGGIKCPDVCYDPNKQLRWKYEKDYERRYGFVSQQFRSFCFLLTRRVADSVRFDERYRDYGFEDVQYGKDLKTAGYEVFAIDNPLENKDIEDSKDFLIKVEESLRSAYKFRDELAEHVSCVKFSREHSLFSHIVRIFYIMFKGAIRSNLLSKSPSLTMFKIYKLGYYTSIKTVLLALLLSIAVPGYSQQLGKERSKMSAFVRNIVRNDAKARKVKGEKSAEHLCAFVRIEGNAEEVLSQYGASSLAHWGNIHIADIPVNSLNSLAQNRFVTRIEAGEPCSVTIDMTASKLSVNDVHQGRALPQAFDGSGVVVGVQDVGFDLTHPTFYSADMKNYRIKRLWDMLSPDSLNSDLYVGRDYLTKEELLGIKHSHDGLIIPHGTHTSSTAAGSGAEGNGNLSPYVGMAPGADLCLVANGTGDNSALVDSTLRHKYTSATDALGFKYIFDYAKSVGKPCVLSFSEGSRDSFYGDEMLFGQVIDSLVGPGRIMLSSAGNEGRNKSYIYKSPDKERAGTFVYNGKSSNILSLVRSYDANLAFRLKFYNKQLQEPLTFTIPSRKVFEAEEGSLNDTAYVSGKDTYLITVSAYPNCYNNEQDAYEIYVQNLNGEKALSSDGTNISIEMLGEGVTAEMFRYSGYFVDNAIDKELSGAVSKYNVNVPSCFPGVICVGATIYRTGVTNYLGTWKQVEKGSDGARSTMSSVGPALSDRIKPDVMAPGCNIIAAYNSFYLENNPDAADIAWDVRHFDYNGRTYPWTSNSGTSMSCPVAAGIIALWLQAKPTLTPQEAMEVIKNTSRKYDATIEYPNNYYGYGEIDAYKGLLEVLELNKTGIISAHQSQKAKVALNGDVLCITLADEPEAEVGVSIYNLKGMKVLEGICGKGQKECRLSMASLQEGVYAVQFTSQDAGIEGSTLIRK